MSNKIIKQVNQFSKVLRNSLESRQIVQPHTMYQCDIAYY